MVIVQTTQDSVVTKVELHKNDGKIDIVNGGTEILIRKMERRIDIYQPMSNKKPKILKVVGLRIC